MGLEVATYINGLVTTNPVGASDPVSQGDDHLRLLKTVLKNTFPNLTGAMTMTQAQLNAAAQTNVGNTFTAIQTIDTGATGAFLGRLLDLKSFAPGFFLWDETTSSQKCLFSLDGNVLSIISTPNTDGTSLTTRMTINMSTGAVDMTGDLNVDGNFTTGGTLLGFPTGTKMLFQQTAAPTGWTKDTTHNNKALRVVTGTASSGGSVAFTTAFASKGVSGSIGSTTVTGTVQNHTLTTAEIPAHTHGPGTLTISGSTNTTGAHTHNTRFFAGTTSGGSDAPGGANNNANETEATTSAGDHSHTVSGTVNGGATASAGSGGAHNHGLSMNSHNHTFTGTAIDLAVQYVDLIIATKD